jgi:tripartite-type tricarboxylate transporter receptor subunit TctC
VVRSSPDGYTLLLVNSQNAISPALYPNLSFNFLRDIAPVSQINLVPLVMEVNPSVPAKTVPEFIAYAKAKPGKINMASAGVGGPQHVAGELFKAMAGVNLVHVPYRGTTPAVTDMLAGQVQVMFDVTPTALPQIKAGKLRALAVTTAKRLDALPDVPAVAEFLPGYEAVAWIGVGAPAGTPAAIVETLNKQINAGLADTAIRTRIADLGGIVKGGSVADFGAFIASETEKWGKVIRDAGIKPE